MRLVISFLGYVRGEGTLGRKGGILWLRRLLYELRGLCRGRRSRRGLCGLSRCQAGHSEPN